LFLPIALLVSLATRPMQLGLASPLPCRSKFFSEPHLEYSLFIFAADPRIDRHALLLMTFLLYDPHPLL
jgi:hypothetical protein